MSAACPECGAGLVTKPVPGAKHFPCRLECPVHGYAEREKRSSFSGCSLEMEIPGSLQEQWDGDMTGAGSR